MHCVKFDLNTCLFRRTPYEIICISVPVVKQQEATHPPQFCSSFATDGGGVQVRLFEGDLEQVICANASFDSIGIGTHPWLSNARRRDGDIPFCSPCPSRRRRSPGTKLKQKEMLRPSASSLGLRLKPNKLSRRNQGSICILII